MISPEAGGAPNLDLIKLAQSTIRGRAVRTPLVRFNADDPSTEIWLKLENLQPVGAFKTRGAEFLISRLSADLLSKGLVTASAGNMAQAVAYTARRLGVPCTVVVPDTAPQAKLAAIQRLGGSIVPVSFDRWWQTLIDRSYPGVEATFVHPFDDPYVMAGNGTIGLEILEDLPQVDTILIPWGGGGLACGIAAAVSAVSPRVKIFATEIETAAPLGVSLRAGSPTEVDYRPSFVDGIGSRTVVPQMLELAQLYLAGSQSVSLAETAAALRLMVERNHVIAEGAGAVSLAVALSDRVGKGPTVCVVSGGNIDSHKLETILEGNLP